MARMQWLVALGSLAALAIATATKAAPITLFTDRALFEASATSPLQIEDFESYPDADQPNPFTFSNATLTSPGQPRTLADNPELCGAATNNCVFDASNITGTRTLSLFPNNTTGVGFDLHAVISSNPFEITVTSADGMLTTPLIGDFFFGVIDPSGIVSISITNVSTDADVNGNYSFDNITTFQGTPPVPVPEPGSLPMLLVALLTLAFWRSGRPLGSRGIHGSLIATRLKNLSDSRFIRRPAGGGSAPAG